MNSFRLTEINIYPVKSLGGISLQSAEVTDRGLKYDRRWMLVDREDKFLTQRTHPQMALIKTKINGNKLILSHKTKNISPLVIPIVSNISETTVVNVWDDLVTALIVGKYADEWLNEALEIKCKMVYMPDDTLRYVERTQSTQNEIVSFADAYPYLMIGQSSLDDLNSRLKDKLPMNRFRPNLVFSGGKPYEEDEWKEFRIGDIIFYGAKQCSRCAITTVDQDTAEKREEPLKILSTYRTVNNKVMFGVNLFNENNGTLKVGDEIIVTSRK